MAFNREFLETFTFPRVPVGLYRFIKLKNINAKLLSALDGASSLEYDGWPFWVSQLAAEHKLAFYDLYLSDTTKDTRTYLFPPPGVDVEAFNVQAVTVRANNNRAPDGHK